ncbi:MAG: retroviral-like aspartic protease family protein [Acidobacteria bacterium]|nr:retroviral-like aspartic protease family protein [Acidobacteriota bacterium]
MPAIRGLVLSLAAVAAVFTLSLGAAGQAQEDSAAQFQAATEFFASARYREALDAYDLALQGNDAALVTRARKGKVRAALRIAEFDLARAEAETLNVDAEADAEAQTLLGDALWANGLFGEADTEYREALEETPGSSRARFGLARSLATRSQLDEALHEALATAAAAPRDAEVHALAGLIYERLNRFGEAADAYERYIALLPMVENNSTAAIAQSKVRLLRSFKGRVPLQVEEATGRVHRLRFRLADRKIVLQGRVNRAPVEFVLDTGAERTGLSDVTARRAGVIPVTATVSAGVGVAALGRIELGRADSIEVGTLRIRNVPVAIRRLVRGALPRWQSESFSPLAMGYSVVIDYQRREVLLARTLPEGQADFRLPMRMNRLPLVRGLLNSTHPAYFVVDTGGELISISAEIALALAMPPARRIPLRVSGIAGVDENAFLLPGVNLDFEEIEYRNVGLAVLNLRAPSVLLGFQLGGIVGHQFLADYRVSLDMGRSEMRLEKF